MDAAAADHRRRLRGRLLLILALGVGLALRLAVAWQRSDVSRAWEAEGFLRCWESQDFIGITRLRPPLPGWILHAAAEFLAAQSILAVRFISVGLSLFGLLGALVLGRVLATRLGHRKPDQQAGMLWIIGCWALLPTLVVSAASPLGDSLLGGCICLTVAAAVRLVSHPGVLRAAWLGIVLLGALLVGGIVVACAVLVALLVFLAPVPPLRAAWLPMTAVLLAFVGGWWVQRGADPDRPWMPDAAPAWSLAALTDAPLLVDDREALDPDVRALAVWETAVHHARDIGPLRVTRDFSLRLIGDLLNPARFDEALGLSWNLWALGLLDLLLRGGLLMFAVAAASMARPQIASAWPRGGLIVGVVTLLLALVLSATNPFALVPLDTLLLGVAGAGIACADPLHRALRWTAFAVGGVLMAGLGLGPLLAEQPLSPWITTLHADGYQVTQLVGALADGGPQTEAAHVFAANMLMERTAPFVRMPEASLRHALSATFFEPFSPRTAIALVNAYLDNLDFPSAQRIADSLRDDNGALTPQGRVLGKWVEECERDWRSARARQ